MSAATFTGGNFIATRRFAPCSVCGQPHEGKWELATNYYAKPYSKDWSDEDMERGAPHEMSVSVGGVRSHNYEIVVVGTLHADGAVSVRGYREYMEHDPKIKRRPSENPLYGLLEFIGGKFIVERECDVWVVVKSKVTPLQQPPQPDSRSPESMDPQPGILLASNPES